MQIDKKLKLYYSSVVGLFHFYLIQVITCNFDCTKSGLILQKTSQDWQTLANNERVGDTDENITQKNGKNQSITVCELSPFDHKILFK